MPFLFSLITPRNIAWMTLLAMLSLGFMFAVMPSYSVAALDVKQGLTDVQTETGLSTTPLPSLVGTIIKAFLGILGVIFLVLMVYAGGLWMTARGNEEQVTQARDIITRAVIGFVVIVLSYAITNFVVDQIAGAASGPIVDPG